jgi:hypothetical protein
MSADDLTEEEVITRFRNIVDISESYLERKEEYKSEILFREEQQEEGTIRERIEKGVKQDKKHDTLLKQTISAFLPDGPIGTQTDWEFLGAEPLSEMNIPNADALFGNPERNLALLVECKTSTDRPSKALQQVYDAADGIRENREYLSEKIGMEIDGIECAICIPSVEDRRLINQIEEHERNNRDRERVFVWRTHYYDGETLDLYTDISTREPGEATHDSELAQILSASVELTYGRQVTPAFFPSSHPKVIMEEALGSILERRILNDGPLRHFKESELREELTTQKSLPHYDSNTIGNRVYDEVVERFADFDIIEEISEGDTELEPEENESLFKYQVRGKSIDTILNNLDERYIEKAVEQQAEIEAMRQVIDDFDDEQSSLGDF